MHISRDVTFVENYPFFYNPSTQPSYSPTESTSFLFLPPISSSDDVIPPPPPPVILIPDPTPSTTSTPPPPPSSKPPITRVYTRRTGLTPSPTSSASPDAPVLDGSDNIEESHAISDELHAGP